MADGTGDPPAPPKTGNNVRPARLACVVAASVLVGIAPVPAGLTPQAWHLFAIFIGAIACVVVQAAPVLIVSLLAVSASVLTRTVGAKQAFAGFSEDFILLIVAAFLMSRAMIESGLGARIAWLVIRRIGRSTLGLAYSFAITDSLIAPAFPSNTARSGVLFPVLQAVCLSGGSLPRDDSRKRLGSFLMMSTMAGVSLSSALWLTAMAANPAGAKIAAEFGVPISFGSWALAASVPCLAALALVPWLLYRVMNPEVKRTPDAPRLAAEALAKLGPVSRAEWIAGATFAVMVILWGLSGLLRVDRTAVAFGGLAALLVTGVYPLSSLRKDGEALETFLWFSILYALSTQLNHLGFMEWLGQGMTRRLEGLPVPAAYVALVLAYVLLHYLFVSQSAHLLALFGVFLGVARSAGVPVPLMAYMLLFATNFFSCVTPQGSSANVLFAGSGYLTAGETYKYGGLVTAANTAVFLAIGTAWIRLVA